MSCIILVQSQDPTGKYSASVERSRSRLGHVSCALLAREGPRNKYYSSNMLINGKEKLVEVALENLGK